MHHGSAFSVKVQIREVQVWDPEKMTYLDWTSQVNIHRAAQGTIRENKYFPDSVTLFY